MSPEYRAACEAYYDMFEKKSPKFLYELIELMELGTKTYNDDPCPNVYEGIKDLAEDAIRKKAAKGLLDYDENGFKICPERYKYGCRHFWRDKTTITGWGRRYRLCLQCANKLGDAMETKIKWQPREDVW